MKDRRPALACPECGVEGLIPAHGRGRYDRDGNDILHADTCRCRWCDWMWFDDITHVTCTCGAVARVAIDDGYAYARAAAP